MSLFHPNRKRIVRYRLRKKARILLAAGVKPDCDVHGRLYMTIEGRRYTLPKTLLLVKE